MRHFWGTLRSRRLAARHLSHTRLSLAEAADRASSHSHASIDAIFSSVKPERIVTWR